MKIPRIHRLLLLLHQRLFEISQTTTSTHTPVHTLALHSEQTTFETLQDMMYKKPVLHQPDFAKPFHLHTDASAYGMGAILS
jgi:RNase H-like domain found in reverse transcriptase